MQIAALHDLVLGARGHHAHVHARADRAVHHAQIDDDAPIGIVLAVEDQRLQRRVGIALGGRHVPHDHLQHGGDVDPVFCRDFRGVLGAQADDILDFLLDLRRPGRGQIDLIDDREDLQVVVDGKIGVGQGLGFHALAGVHHQHRALAGGQAAGNFIVEIHMARGIDEIQHIVLPVQGMVIQPHGPGLDGDAALALELHGIEDLVLHIPELHGIAHLQQTVCQGGLAVVDMGDDGKITDQGLVCQAAQLLPGG